MEKRAVIDENTPQPEAEQPTRKPPMTKQAADKIEDSAATRLAAAAAEKAAKAR